MYPRIKLRTEDPKSLSYKIKRAFSHKDFSESPKKRKHSRKPDSGDQQTISMSSLPMAPSIEKYLELKS
jgi:hypothetical protein